jgi:hypothetical protein
MYQWTFLEAAFQTWFFVCMYVGFYPPLQSEVIPQNSMFDITVFKLHIQYNTLTEYHSLVVSTQF